MNPPSFLRSAIEFLIILAGLVVATHETSRVGGPWASALISGVLLAMLFARNFYLRRELAYQANLAITDDLTGLENDRSFREALTSGAAGLILFDIDQFKTYNDAQGHPAGDQVLRDLGQILEKEPKVYRVGGDEFALIVHDPDSGALWNQAEVIRSRMRGHGWPIRQMSASFGLAITRPGFDANDLLDRADQALYRAKRRGGDQICFSEND